jgi:hypothetical protein
LPRYNEVTGTAKPEEPDFLGSRHWGDGLAGPIVATRPQGYHAATPEDPYRDLAVNNDGNLLVVSSGGGGGGIVEQGAGAGAAAPWAFRLSDGAAFYVGAKEHVAANDPHAVRLTDGSAFYKPTTPVDTQPVSGPLTDAQLRAASVPISGTVTANAGTGPFPVSDNGGSLTVDGSVAVSNFPAVQPVSDNGATLSVDDGAGSLTVDGTVAATQSGIWTVQPGNTPNTTPWLVKRSLENARQQVLLSWDEMAGTAAVESALTNATFRTENAVALGAASLYTVPAGKTLRITEVHCYVKATSTVNNLARFRIRQAAAVANTSPVIFNAIQAIDAPGTVAANLMSHRSYPLGDGIDVATGQQVAFTWLTAANTCTVGMTIIGFLYTA